MFSINFIGRVSKDATFKQFATSNVLNFTVAVNFPTQAKDENGNTVSDTIFIPCSKWNFTGDVAKVSERLKKGMRVAVQGSKMELTTHQDQATGKEYTNLNVVVQTFEALDFPTQPQAVAQGFVPQQGQAPQGYQQGQVPQATPQQAFPPRLKTQQGQAPQGYQQPPQPQGYQQAPPEVRHTYQQPPQGLDDVDLSY